MMRSSESIARLVHKFSTLPGVGQKTAMRYAYFIIESDPAVAAEFSRAIVDAKEKVKLCKSCFMFCEGEECAACLTREKNIICVVAYPKDVLVLEKAGFKGVYHVLGGTISPLDGRGPDDIRVKELLNRLDEVSEVIMATNPDVEGEATALYIAKLIKPLGIEVSRIATGISMGSEIEYADEVTLGRALNQRTCY